jgi:hypothetical protein
MIMYYVLAYEYASQDKYSYLQTMVIAKDSKECMYEFNKLEDAIAFKNTIHPELKPIIVQTTVLKDY